MLCLAMSLNSVNTELLRVRYCLSSRCDNRLPKTNEPPVNKSGSKTAKAPTASFNAEGGFAAGDEYLWSPASEESLQDRLGKLLDGE